MYIGQSPLLIVNDSEYFSKVITFAEFRCYIEKSGEGMTTLQIFYDGLLLRLCRSAVDSFYTNIRSSEGSYLIVLCIASMNGL